MLHCGDCLEVMRGMEAGLVDLIYADPPYCTQRDWGEFDDRWESFDVYLAYMEERLRECHRVLAETGSLYLHVDPTTSHYLKVMLDGIFGRKNFRNEIVWSYRRGRMSANQHNFNRTHDIILRYCKTNFAIWNQTFEPLSDLTMQRTKGMLSHRDKSGGKVKLVLLNKESPGAPMRDVWEIPYLFAVKPERTGYPTQKPIALLDRIIRASSNAEDLVLDPFCGSGTTLAAARQLGRRYIGIDQNPNAISLCEKRLTQTQPALIAA